MSMNFLDCAFRVVVGELVEFGQPTIAVEVLDGDVVRGVVVLSPSEAVGFARDLNRAVRAAYEAARGGSLSEFGTGNDFVDRPWTRLKRP